MGEGAIAGEGVMSRAAALPGAAGGSGIGFEDVTVAYKGQVVLDALTLAAQPGEIMAVIGPSGSGKTTALRAVAGFVRPARGRVWIGDRDVTDLPPNARDIGMVVQNYALFPHMRVDQNVAFGLHARRAADALIRERVRDCLAMVGMAEYATRYPRQLSGGQQQRVAIARALAIQPRVLLLDEPLSALDAQIRRSMLTELARLHRALPSLTVLYVTHDQTEALTLGDSIAIMRAGRLVAHGRSQMLYREPPNRFAAEFLGRANLLPVQIESRQAGASTMRVRFGPAPLLAMAPGALLTGPDCLLCVRPHALTLEAHPSLVNTLPATVRSVEWQGDQHSLELDMAGTIVRLVCMPLRDPPLPGAAVQVHFAADDASLIPADAPGADA
jgi:2-aminoethylphosphonate transport system ATP-binding protein